MQFDFPAILPEMQNEILSHLDVSTRFSCALTTRALHAKLFGLYDGGNPIFIFFQKGVILYNRRKIRLGHV